MLLRRSRDEVGALARTLAVPGVAAVCAVLAGVLVADRVDDPLWGGLLGGVATLGVYTATTLAWALPRVRAVRATLDGPDTPDDPGPDIDPDPAPDQAPPTDPPETAEAPTSLAGRPRGTTR